MRCCWFLTDGLTLFRGRDDRDGRIHAFMAKGTPIWEWKNELLQALLIYIPLYEAFGATPFEKVFTEYRRLPDAGRPKSDDEKRDQWQVRLSQTVGKNLGPFFQAWGVPTSERATASIGTESIDKNYRTALFRVITIIDGPSIEVIDGKSSIWRVLGVPTAASPDLYTC
jgi:hypothetical protein